MTQDHPAFVPVPVAAAFVAAPTSRVRVWIVRYKLPTRRDHHGRVLVSLAAVCRTDTATRPERERRRARVTPV